MHHISSVQSLNPSYTSNNTASKASYASTVHASDASTTSCGHAPMGIQVQHRRDGCLILNVKPNTSEAPSFVSSLLPLISDQRKERDSVRITVVIGNSEWKCTGMSSTRFKHPLRSKMFAHQKLHFPVRCNTISSFMLSIENPQPLINKSVSSRQRSQTNN